MSNPTGPCTFLIKLPNGRWTYCGAPGVAGWLVAASGSYRCGDHAHVQRIKEAMA